MMRSFYFVLLLAALCGQVKAGGTDSCNADGFSWRGATVYFVLTDRFCNGDTANDVNYGRVVDYGSERLNAATFHGGDFRGMLRKAREGYFTELGVDVVWMTDVYEQVHGWIPGSGGAVNDFPHYGYHGYYPLDYTQTDKNYGTMEELRELVDCLHSQGIRVMLGANLNDPGYPTLLDAVQYGFAPVQGMTEVDAVRHDRNFDYDGWANGNDSWTAWWTSQWVRTAGEQWNPDDPLTTTLYGMPDFKTEKMESVRLPEFLKKKWKREGRKNDKWVNPSACNLRKDRDWPPSRYVTAWIASWVEELGIDGMRCDVVEYVHLPRWKELSEACNEALSRWRAAHPDDPASRWRDRFYMTGDMDGASIDRLSDYADAGFTSMVNFYFPKHGDLDAIVYTWQAYADSMAAHRDWHPFSYLNNSYHRDADASNMADCATTLLLSPGVAQIFYGDESGRTVSEAIHNADYAQAFRSDMNWDTTDTAMLDHFRRLGAIRRAHPAIASGRQVTLDAHTCVRQLDGDTVIIRLRPESGRVIRVAPFIADGTVVTELYTGHKATVSDGCVMFDDYRGNVAVIKK